MNTLCMNCPNDYCHKCILDKENPASIMEAIRIADKRGISYLCNKSGMMYKVMDYIDNRRNDNGKE